MAGGAGLRGWNVGLRAALPALLALMAALVAFGMLPGRAGSASHGLATTLVVSRCRRRSRSTACSPSRPSSSRTSGRLTRTRRAPASGSPRASRCRASLSPTREVHRGRRWWSTAGSATVRAGARDHPPRALPPELRPPDDHNAVRVARATRRRSAASGPSYFLNRYWICGCATVYTYPNGWTVPATDQGVTVGPERHRVTCRRATSSHPTASCIFPTGA